jgi:hypothetical protein
MMKSLVKYTAICTLILSFLCLIRICKNLYKDYRVKCALEIRTKLPVIK